MWRELWLVACHEIRLFSYGYGCYVVVGKCFAISFLRLWNGVCEQCGRQKLRLMDQPSLGLTICLRYGLWISYSGQFLIQRPNGIAFPSELSCSLSPSYYCDNLVYSRSFNSQLLCQSFNQTFFSSTSHIYSLIISGKL